MPSIFHAPVTTTINAVAVQTITVSMKGSHKATRPSVAGCLVFTAECAIGAEPRPASFEKAARWKPASSAPITPPAAASPLKAEETINPIAPGSASMWTTSTAPQPTRYTRIMAGISFSVTRPMRVMPPSTTRPASVAMPMPNSQPMPSSGPSTPPVTLWNCAKA